MYRVIVALVAALLVGGLSFAFKFVTQEKAGPEYIDKVYDLQDLVRTELQPWEGRTRAPFDPPKFGYLDGEAFDESGQWWLIAGTEDNAVRSAQELRGFFMGIADGDDLKSCDIDEKPVNRARVRATAACHERIEWFLGAMRSHVRARIEVEVLRLPARPASPVLNASAAAASGGALVATARIRQGGVAHFEKLTERSVVYDFDYFREDPLDRRLVGGLFEGETWRVAALALADGRIRLQAAHARANDVDVRKWDLPEGPLELPALRWRFTPGAATVENGGGLALDCGDGHFLVRVRCDTALSNLSREDGRLRLINPGGAARAGVMAGRWLIQPIADAREYRDRLLPQHDEFESIRPDYEFPRCNFAELLEQDSNHLTFGELEVHLSAWGPVVLRRAHGMDRADPEALKIALTQLDAQLDALNSQAKVWLLNVAVFRLGEPAVLPGGVIGGSPSDADIELLRATKGATVLLDRTLAMEAGQVCDVADVHMRNYLGAWHPHGEQERRRWEPVVVTDVSGWQLRVGRDSDDRTMVRFGLHDLARLKVIEGTGGMKGRDLESPEGWRIEGSLNVVAKAGEWASVVQSMGESARVVVCVKAVQP